MKFEKESYVIVVADVAGGSLRVDVEGMLCDIYICCVDSESGKRCRGECESR